jgi:hypothetical protein
MVAPAASDGESLLLKPEEVKWKCTKDCYHYESSRIFHLSVLSLGNAPAGLLAATRLVVSWVIPHF